MSFFRRLKTSFISMVRCVAMPLRRTVTRKYDVITSIGVNCEVSFNINRIYGFVDSYPLSWAYVDSVGSLTPLLIKPTEVFDSDNIVHDCGNNMVLYQDVGVKFHCKSHPSALLDDSGNINSSVVEVEERELKERMKYLSSKWSALLENERKSVLCVMTIWERTTTKEILSVNAVLSRYPNVDMLVVLTGREPNVSIAELRKSNIAVATVRFHPPIDATSDFSKTDVDGWDAALAEFRPKKYKSGKKRFKFDRRK